MLKSGVDPTILLFTGINRDSLEEIMEIKKNYRKTQLACYLGFVTQAICANFVPLLYITFHNDYDISFGMLALIS